MPQLLLKLYTFSNEYVIATTIAAIAERSEASWQIVVSGTVVKGSAARHIGGRLSGSEATWQTVVIVPPYHPFYLSFPVPSALSVGIRFSIF